MPNFQHCILLAAATRDTTRRKTTASSGLRSYCSFFWLPQAAEGCQHVFAAVADITAILFCLPQQGDL